MKIPRQIARQIEFAGLSDIPSVISAESGTVPLALEHSQVRPKRANRLPVLVSQNSGDLMQVSHVMSSPRGQQF